jgi:hypothetical protein
MGILIATLGESTSSGVEDVFKLYAETYNGEIRKKLSKMPALYPKYANQMLEVIDKFNNDLSKGE